MATNQRENERNERKLKKQHKASLIFWCVVLVIVLVFLVMKLCEIDYSSIKNRLSGSTSISQAISDDEKFPYLLDVSENVVLSDVGSKLAVMNVNSITVINSNNARPVFSDDHGYANPIMKSSGSYALIFDQGTGKYRLDSSTGNVYTDTVHNSILCADVSANGTVAMATTSSEAKSDIFVYNKSLKQKMKYSVSSGYVTDIAIDERANRIAFCVINSENAIFKTTVYTMVVGDDAPVTEFKYSSSIIDISFYSSKLYVVGTDFVSLITAMKNENPIFEKGSINVGSFAYNSSGMLFVSYTAYTGDASNKIACISPSGKVKTTIEVNAPVKDISASSSVVSALTDKQVVSYSISKGEVKKQTEVDESYSSIIHLSSKIFAQHRSYIELL